MKLRRTLSILLALTFLFICLPHTGAFSDTVGHQAAEAIERWSARGIVMGYGGAFRPDDPITRAEMAVIIDRMVSYQHTASNTFEDLDEGWYTDAILKVNAAGVIQGYEDKVRPFDNITRAEAVVMLARTFAMEPNANGVSLFDDADAIPDWAAGYIGAMAYADVLPFEGSFLPDQEITRAEVVLILDLFFPAVYDTAGVYTDNIHGNLLVTSSHVVLTDVTVSGDVYLAGQAGELTLSNAHILGKVYHLTGTDITTDDESFSGGLDDPGNVPDTVPVQPDGDIESELQLSYTGSETVSVILRAGYSLAQIFTILEEKAVCSATELFTACETIDFSRYYPYLTDAYAAKDRVFALEGYLAPGTYTFYLGSSPELVLKTILDRSSEQYTDYAAQANLLGYTLDEIITIASILEKEVGNCTEQDRATVASIIYNRLESGTKLQMNVTENYLETYVLPYCSISLDQYAEAYDTYLCEGLPAGAICSPRESCIEAALAPYTTDYLFFRSDRYGNIYYAATYEEHVQNASLADAATEYLGYLGNVSDSDEEEPYIPVEGPYSGVTIMLDPGHGGAETGSYTGDASEKDINLAVAEKLRDILRAEGVNVLMTRDGDYYLSAEERVELAGEQSPDLFLSIHCNSFENDASVNGIETYYYPGDEASSLWASYVQTALIASSSASDRGVKQNELIVLHYTEMPSIMTELGFLTNLQENELLQSDAYQELLAQALAEGTFHYLDDTQIQ